jgi:LCP family protein required for cell wall assembly
MSDPRRPRARVAAVVLTLLVLVAVVVIRVHASLEREAGTTRSVSATSTTATLSPSPSSASQPLQIRLGAVHGRAVAGKVHPSDLKAAARAVRETMTRLYSIGFVDPGLWSGGRFPALPDLFAPSARSQVHRDLADLSLGRTARTLTSVEPTTARLDLAFLTDAKARPVTAFADMRFEGIGQADDGVEVSIEQSGHYVVKRTNAGWSIVGYRVQARVPPPGHVRAQVRMASLPPSVPRRAPFFLLVIGSDARPGQSVSRTRADSLHIVAFNPRVGRGTIVGIPRDSYVPIPGRGVDKINASLSLGGPQLVVQTVEHLTGVHIDAYVLTGFDGFKRLVNAIGGLKIQIPYRMNDPFSKAHFRPGPAKLSARQALAFSRDRHDVPGGDFGRSKNQGRVILAALQQLRERFHHDPASMIPWAVAGTAELQTDLTLEQTVDLLLEATTIRPSRIRNTVVSGSGATVHGLSVVRLGSKAHAVFHDLARDGVLGGRR